MRSPRPRAERKKGRALATGQIVDLQVAVRAPADGDRAVLREREREHARRAHDEESELGRRGVFRNGVTWHFNRPPVEGLDYEMDCRCVYSERVVT